MWPNRRLGTHAEAPGMSPERGRCLGAKKEVALPTSPMEPSLRVNAARFLLQPRKKEAILSSNRYWVSSNPELGLVIAFQALLG